jgi:hypothetical protein
MAPSTARRTSFSSSKSDDTTDLQALLDEEKGQYKDLPLSSPEPQSLSREKRHRRILQRVHQYVMHFFLITLALLIVLAGSIKNHLVTEQICTRTLSVWCKMPISISFHTYFCRKQSQMKGTLTIIQHPSSIPTQFSTNGKPGRSATHQKLNIVVPLQWKGKPHGTNCG